MNPCCTNPSSSSTFFLRLPARVLLLALFLIAGVSGLHAQFDAGAVLGTIKDTSGSNIAAAAVQLLNVSKGLKVVRQTDGNGDYEFDSVQAGEYTLTVSAPGFSTSTTDPFTVTVGSRQRVGLTLRLGSNSESVTVSDAASQLETETSDRGETVQTAEAVTLPLNGRSYADLSVLVPGVRKSLLGTVASNPPRTLRTTPTA